MKQCKDCVHFKVCEFYEDGHYLDGDCCMDANQCSLYATAADDHHADVRNYFLNTLSDLKKEIHDKAVYPMVPDIKPYISIRAVDAIINNYIEGERRKNEKHCGDH